ncbi:MAG TPA: LD-carboxypeptidase [Kofleriaceae bacterium]|nr:LD-carboxypeptidase [Kofleriaceae bacterium]
MTQADSASTSVIPPAIRPGDKIAVPAPASPVGDDLLAGLGVLGRRYRIAIDPQVRSAAGFLAGSDDRRAGELNAYLADPDVRGIWIARGGYGIMRILPLLDGDLLRRDPKPIIGFSDGTALLAWAHKIAGVRGIHGPVVTQLGRLPAADAVWAMDLAEGALPREPVAIALTVHGEPRGQFSGPLVGGNLCLVARLVGTPYAVDFSGAVAFFEEVGERPYRIDRDLTQIMLATGPGSSPNAPGGPCRRTGENLAGARCAVIGDLVDCGDARPIIAERLGAAGLAGAFGLPVGHGRRNRAVPFGARVTLDGASGTLSLDEPATRA